MHVTFLIYNTIACIVVAAGLYSWFKRGLRNWAFWIAFLLISLYAISSTIYGLGVLDSGKADMGGVKSAIDEKGEKEIKHMDSLGNEQSKEHENILNKIDKKNDSAINRSHKEDPLLNIPSQPTNSAVVWDTENEKYVHKFSFTNVRAGEAFDIRTHIVIVYKQDDQVTSTSLESEPLDESVIVVKPSVITIICPLELKRGTGPEFFPDTMYFYIRLKYKNEKGTEQKPFRAMYLFTPEMIGKQMKSVTRSRYNEIKEGLLKLNKW